MHKILVEVSSEQSRVFDFIAREIGAKPGEILLAFACERMLANSHTEIPDNELMGWCWRYSHLREVPDPSRWLNREQMERLRQIAPSLAAVS